MTQDNIEEAVAEVTDPQLADRALRAFANWTQGKEYAAKERKRLSELVSNRKAQFDEAMNVGHNSVNDQVLKLSVVETRWQELQEAIAEKKTINGALKDAIKVAEQKIKDVIAEAKTAQMNLFGGDAAAEEETEE